MGYYKCGICGFANNVIKQKRLEDLSCPNIECGNALLEYKIDSYKHKNSYNKYSKSELERHLNLLEDQIINGIENINKSMSDSFYYYEEHVDKIKINITEYVSSLIENNDRKSTPELMNHGLLTRVIKYSPSSNDTLVKSKIRFELDGSIQRAFTGNNGLDVAKRKNWKAVSYSAFQDPVKLTNLGLYPTRYSFRGISIGPCKITLNKGFSHKEFIENMFLVMVDAALPPRQIKVMQAIRGLKKKVHHDFKSYLISEIDRITSQKFAWTSDMGSSLKKKPNNIDYNKEKFRTDVDYKWSNKFTKRGEEYERELYETNQTCNNKEEIDGLRNSFQQTSNRKLMQSLNKALNKDDKFMLKIGKHQAQDINELCEFNVQDALKKKSDIDYDGRVEYNEVLVKVGYDHKKIRIAFPTADSFEVCQEDISRLQKYLNEVKKNVRAQINDIHGPNIYLEELDWHNHTLDIPQSRVKAMSYMTKNKQTKRSFLDEIATAFPIYADMGINSLNGEYTKLNKIKIDDLKVLSLTSPSEKLKKSLFNQVRAIVIFLNGCINKDLTTLIQSSANITGNFHSAQELSSYFTSTLRYIKYNFNLDYKKLFVKIEWLGQALGNAIVKNNTLHDTFLSDNQVISHISNYSKEYRNLNRFSTSHKQNQYNSILTEDIGFGLQKEYFSPRKLSDRKDSISYKMSSKYSQNSINGPSSSAALAAYFLTQIAKLDEYIGSTVPFSVECALMVVYQHHGWHSPYEVVHGLHYFEAYDSHVSTTEEFHYLDPTDEELTYRVKNTLSTGSSFNTRVLDKLQNVKSINEIPRKSIDLY